MDLQLELRRRGNTCHLNTGESHRHTIYRSGHETDQTKSHRRYVQRLAYHAHNGLSKTGIELHAQCSKLRQPGHELHQYGIQWIYLDIQLGLWTGVQSIDKFGRESKWHNLCKQRYEDGNLYRKQCSVQ